jgi:hypothetical protein
LFLFSGRSAEPERVLIQTSYPGRAGEILARGILGYFDQLNRDKNELAILLGRAS